LIILLSVGTAAFAEHDEFKDMSQDTVTRNAWQTVGDLSQRTWSQVPDRQRLRRQNQR